MQTWSKRRSSSWRSQSCQRPRRSSILCASESRSGASVRPFARPPSRRGARSSAPPSTTARVRPQPRQPAAQPQPVHGVRERGVVALVDQERQRQRAQHALGGAAPGRLLLAHLHQLAGERQRRLVETQRRGDALARVDLLLRDVRLAPRQPFLLGARELEGLAHAVERHARRAVPVPRARALGGRGVDRRALLVDQRDEGLAGPRQGQPQRLAARDRLVAARVGGLRLTLLPLAVALQRLQPPAARRVPSGQEIAHRRARGLEIAIRETARVLARRAFALELGAPRLEQRQPQSFHERGQGLGLGRVARDRDVELGQALVGGARRDERLDLPARGHDRLVRGLQLAELVDEALGDREGLGLVEHELAQERVQVAEVLRRLRLVQQPERHLALDAEPRGEALAVVREFAEVGDVRQRRLQAPKVEPVVAERGELLQRQVPLGDEVVPAHVGGRVAVAAQPEDLGDRDGLAARVRVAQRDRRPRGARAKVALGHLAGAGVAVLRPRAAHVGDEVPVPARALVLARGGVEVEPARRHQQRRDRVQQRRLARARAADEQEAVRADVDPVQAVEGAPVEHLEPRHAKRGGVERRFDRAHVVHVASPFAVAVSSGGVSSPPPPSVDPVPDAPSRSYSRSSASTRSAENRSFSVGAIS